MQFTLYLVVSTVIDFFTQKKTVSNNGQNKIPKNAAKRVLIRFSDKTNVSFFSVYVVTAKYYVEKRFFRQFSRINY